MLDTLRKCPAKCTINLTQEFKKDLAWFHEFLSQTDGVYIIHQETRTPVPLYVDACSSSRGVLTGAEGYHSTFFTSILQQDRPICQLDVLNAMVAGSLVPYGI